MTGSIPNDILAGELAALAIGQQPIAVRRFPTGSQHYVFEARFADRAPVVVRVTLPEYRALMVGAATLSRHLRPLGVRLPAILAEDLVGPFPYLILERLAGTDLGHVAKTLPDAQLEAIAAHVVEAQQIVGTTPTAGRYGYAVKPADAPHGRWSDILAASIDRSRRRIETIGLFDLAPVRAAEAALSGLRVEADAQPATPHLHDTTTKNVIIGPDGSFSGIVDVDDLCFGDPRYVVALTLAALTAFGGPARYAGMWMRRAGFSDDRLFRFYVALCYLDFMSEQGQVFNGNQQADSSAHLRAHLARCYAVALEAAG